MRKKTCAVLGINERFDGSSQIPRNPVVLDSANMLSIANTPTHPLKEKLATE
jgi:hypothetical protein